MQKTTVTMPIWAYIPFSIVVMLATTNAINLTDGIDGLSTSVTTIILTCLTVIGIVTGVKKNSCIWSKLNRNMLSILII